MSEDKKAKEILTAMVGAPIAAAMVAPAAVAAAVVKPAPVEDKRTPAEMLAEITTADAKLSDLTSKRDKINDDINALNKSVEATRRKLVKLLGGTMTADKPAADKPAKSVTVKPAAAKKDKPAKVAGEKSRPKDGTVGAVCLESLQSGERSSEQIAEYCLKSGKNKVTPKTVSVYLSGLKKKNFIKQGSGRGMWVLA